MFQTGSYTCLEIFAKSLEGKQGKVSITDKDGNRKVQKTGEHYYAWLKFTLEAQKEYELSAEDAQITLAYLSGAPDMLETGITYLNWEHGGSLVTKADYVRQYDTCFREQYHFVPWMNWINDPNGLCWYKGYYHLFYQYNPHGQEWSNMYWGHAVSKDLVHWRHLPVVLEPQAEILEQPKQRKGGAFSGSAVVLEEQVVFYLTRHIGPLEDGEDTVQTQWMMKSRDMINFEPEKLIIDEKPQGATHDFRDPKVIKLGDTWYLVLASALNGKAAILLYTSLDMENWSYTGPLLTEMEEGIQCFECPDFFELDGTYVAMGAWMCHRDEANRYQMSRYYTGDFNGASLGVKNSGWFDFGSNCYAMQSFEHEGRRISLGWISDFYGEHMEVPKGAYGSMTIPRELHIKENRLFLTPVEEIYTLKGETLYKGSGEPVEIRKIPGNSYYAKIKFKEDTDFSILLGEDDNKRIWFVKDEKGAGIKTQGVKSEDISFPAEVERVEELEIFVDRRTVEIYVNKGEAAGTKLFYNSQRTGCFCLEAEHKKALEEVEVTVMKSTWH